MRLEVFKNGEKLEFENIYLKDYFNEILDKIDLHKPHEFEFASIHQMLVEENKELLERAFQDEKKESK